MSKHLPPDDELRRILREPGDAHNGWDEPGDHVWSNIAAAIGEKANRKGFFWWWIPFLLGGSVLVYFLFHQQVSSAKYDANRSDSFNEPAFAKNKEIKESGSSFRIISELKEPVQYEWPPSAEISGKNAIKFTAAGFDNLSGGRNVDKGIIRASTDEDRFESNQLSEADIVNHEIKSDEFGGTSSKSIAEGIASLDDKDIAEQAAASEHESVSGEGIIQDDIIPRTELIESVESKEIKPADVTPIASSSKGWRTFVGMNAHGVFAGIHRHGNHPGQGINLQPAADAFRIGCSFEKHHTSGWYLGAGIQYLQFSIERENNRSWSFTRQGAMQIAGGYRQFIPLNLESEFGETQTVLRVDIVERNTPLDYQEGEEVLLTTRLRQQLSFVRIPITAGYRYTSGNWFASIAIGAGLNVRTGYSAEINNTVELRNRIITNGRPAIRKPDGLKDSTWDTHGGLSVGYCWKGKYMVSGGYESWYQVTPIVQNSNFKNRLYGHGISIGMGFVF